MMNKASLRMLAAICSRGWAILVVLCGVVSAQAQKIQVVDSEGNGIALVTVMDGNGVFIGTTDLDGVLADVKGATTVAVTHVAYKPQSVTVASLNGGRITMEDNDFDISELVVTPKPLLYVEVYYRVYAYLNDSLRCYHAGILPCSYDSQKKKVEAKFTDYACAVFNLKDVSWWKVRTEGMAKGGALRPVPPELSLTNGKWKEVYDIKKVADGPNRWKIVNPRETVGQLVRANGLSTITIDGAKAQMYANEIHGETKMLKRRQESNYTYQYTTVYNIGEDGETDIEDYVMSVNHWETDTKKGHETYIVEAWVTDRGYMTKDEFKLKRKEINALSSTQNMWHMPLKDLEAYERRHDIPAITEEVRKAVALITRDRWTR